MANEIKLITFADSEVTATDDAYVYESAIGEGGIINGCEVTIKNASELHINGGNGVLCGRKFTVYDSDLPVTLSSSGTLLGRLYIHMDLSNASTPIQLMIETGGSLTPVQQDADVNATNGVYEINLSTFNVDTSTISDLVDVSPKVYTHEVLNTIEECVASTNPGDIAGASVISTLNSNISLINREYVEITTVAGDTNASGLTKLFNAIDINKLTYKSMIYIEGTMFKIDGGIINGANTFFNMSSVPILNSSSVVIDRVLFRASSPQYYRATIKASPAFAFTDYTSQSIGAGISIRLYY